MKAKENSPALRVVDFSADWCSPCRAQKKVLVKLEKVRPDVKVEYIDIETDEGGAFADKHSVESIPTMLVMQGDKMLHRLEGLATLKEIEECLPKVEAVQD
jgi:thioredoxin 1